MSKFIIFSLSLLSLVACNNSQQSTPADDSTVLAATNDNQITQAGVDAYLAGQGVNQATEQQQQQGLDELVQLMALAELAEKQDLQIPLQQHLLLQQAKHRALAQLAIGEHLKQNPITDEDIQNEYQRITGELKGEEFRVSHLLYQDETAAIQVLDAINSGSDYMQAEQTYLAANPNVKNVGDIGWVNLMQVPEVFRAPLQSMKNGSVHTKTLVSQFGVHVLYLADKRSLEAPALEAVKPGIQKTLEQQKVDRYRQLAVIKAKVKTTDKPSP